MATNYEVVQAQRDFADARNNELRALLNYRKALVNFETRADRRHARRRRRRDGWRHDGADRWHGWRTARAVAAARAGGGGVQ